VVVLAEVGKEVGNGVEAIVDFRVAVVIIVDVGLMI
jgi:hypothetical protein